MHTKAVVIYFELAFSNCEEFPNIVFHRYISWVFFFGFLQLEFELVKQAIFKLFTIVTTTVVLLQLKPLSKVSRNILYELVKLKDSLF